MASGVTTGEAEIVGVLGEVVNELKKIRNATDNDGRRLRIAGMA